MRCWKCKAYMSYWTSPPHWRCAHCDNPKGDMTYEENIQKDNLYMPSECCGTCTHYKQSSDGFMMCYENPDSPGMVDVDGHCSTGYKHRTPVPRVTSDELSVINAWSIVERLVNRTYRAAEELISESLPCLNCGARIDKNSVSGVCLDCDI